MPVRHSSGIFSSRASPLPEPLGITAKATSLNTSSEATSLIVPSPPQAMISEAPAAIASRAEHGTVTGALSEQHAARPLVGRKASLAPRQSAAAQAPAVRQCPEIGLTMIDTKRASTPPDAEATNYSPRVRPWLPAFSRKDSYFLTWRSTVGGRNQTREAARFDVRLPRSIRQIPPFLERERTAGADQVRGELAQIRLMAHQGDAPAFGNARQMRDDRCRRMSRRQGIEQLDGRLPFQTGRQQLGGLPRTDERAGERPRRPSRQGDAGLSPLL
jgi:hypothetical protein